ncbi:MAG: Maf family protein, partial [Mucinivorans sp.]
APHYFVDESFPSSIKPHDVPSFLSELKSKGYPLDIKENEILITADTVVIENNEIIGKPTSRDAAIKILEKLSGKKHEVLSAVTLRTIDGMHTFTVSTDVYFRELSQEEIIYYIDKYHPMDKAGAYGIQEWIGCTAVKKISGSFYNVMGLPIQVLYTELNKFIK